MNWKILLSVFWAVLIILLTYPTWVLQFIVIKMGNVDFGQYLYTEVIKSSKEVAVFFANLVIVFFVGFDFFTDSNSNFNDKNPTIRWKFYAFFAFSMVISLLIYNLATIQQEISPLIASDVSLFILWIAFVMTLSYMKYICFSLQEITPSVKPFVISPEEQNYIHSMPVWDDTN